jgi:hypothetical protein
LVEPGQPLLNRLYFDDFVWFVILCLKFEILVFKMPEITFFGFGRVGFHSGRFNPPGG